MPVLTNLLIAAPPEPWAALGFSVDADGVGPGGLLDVGVGQRRGNVLPGPGVAAQQDDQCIEQPRDVVGDGVLGVSGVEGLGGRFTQPAAEDLGAAFREQRGHVGQVRITGNLGHAVLDVVHALIRRSSHPAPRIGADGR